MQVDHVTTQTSTSHFASTSASVSASDYFFERHFFIFLFFWFQIIQHGGRLRREDHRRCVGRLSVRISMITSSSRAHNIQLSSKSKSPQTRTGFLLTMRYEYTLTCSLIQSLSSSLDLNPNFYAHLHRRMTAPTSLCSLRRAGEACLSSRTP